MIEMVQTVTTVANRAGSPVGPAPVFTPRGSLPQPPAPMQAATCDACSCRISRCSGGGCCY